jgi:hypothetical protein
MTRTDRSTPPADRGTAYEGLSAFLEAPPRLDPTVYGIDPYDRNGARQAAARRRYQTEKRRISRDLTRARAELARFQTYDYDPATLAAASAETYSGRLTIHPDGTVDYTPGQYRPTEYRAAAAAVLADYNARRHTAAKDSPLPPPPTDWYTDPATEEPDDDAVSAALCAYFSARTTGSPPDDAGQEAYHAVQAYYRISPPAE